MGESMSSVQAMGQAPFKASQPVAMGGVNSITARYRPGGAVANGGLDSSQRVVGQMPPTMRPLERGPPSQAQNLGVQGATQHAAHVREPGSYSQYPVPPGNGHKAVEPMMGQGADRAQKPGPALVEDLCIIGGFANSTKVNKVSNGT